MPLTTCALNIDRPYGCVSVGRCSLDFLNSHACWWLEAASSYMWLCKLASRSPMDPRQLANVKAPGINHPWIWCWGDPANVHLSFWRSWLWSVARHPRRSAAWSAMISRRTDGTRLLSFLPGGAEQVSSNTPPPPLPHASAWCLTPALLLVSPNISALQTLFLSLPTCPVSSSTFWGQFLCV